MCPAVDNGKPPVGEAGREMCQKAKCRGAEHQEAGSADPSTSGFFPFSSQSLLSVIGVWLSLVSFISLLKPPSLPPFLSTGTLGIELSALCMLSKLSTTGLPLSPVLSKGPRWPHGSGEHGHR